MRDLFARVEPAFHEFRNLAYRYPAEHMNDRIGEDDLEAFYRDHIRKLLWLRGGRRYLSKGNYNTTRIAYLARLFPDARFIVPVRDPTILPKDFHSAGPNSTWSASDSSPGPQRTNGTRPRTSFRNAASSPKRSLYHRLLGQAAPGLISANGAPSSVLTASKTPSPTVNPWSVTAIRADRASIARRWRRVRR